MRKHFVEKEEVATCYIFKKAKAAHKMVGTICPYLTCQPLQDSLCRGTLDHPIEPNTCKCGQNV